jgi:hypothetical protein
MLPYMMQGNNIVVVVNNTPHTIAKTHVTYTKVKDAIIAGDWETVKKIIDPEKVVLEYGNGRVAVQGEKLFWDGREMHNALSKRMIEMLQEGFPIEPLVLFMENLQNNPSHRAVKELYGFLEKNRLPITPDGGFLAYKRVRDSYLDCYSGTVSNKPAYLLTDEEKTAMADTVSGRLKEVEVTLENDMTVVTMPRNMVNDDKDQTCSDGLHFCSEDYLNSFGGERIMILKINPMDVVSVPSDYRDSKGRTCAYTVVGELGVDPAEAFTAAVQETANTATE